MKKRLLATISVSASLSLPLTCVFQDTPPRHSRPQFPHFKTQENWATCYRAASSSGCLGINPASTSYWLCDLGQDI